MLLATHRRLGIVLGGRQNCGECNSRLGTRAHVHTCKLQDHPNLGLCLDSAHIAVAPAYGYIPSSGEGYTEDLFQAELDRLRALPADKIHFYEISDMIKPQKAVPLGRGSEYDAYHASFGHKARDLFTWSMCGRCVPLVGKNAGQDVHGPGDMGDARCIEVTQAIFSTGFRGKVFSSTRKHPLIRQARVRLRCLSSSTWTRRTQRCRRDMPKREWSPRKNCSRRSPIVDERPQDT